MQPEFLTDCVGAFVHPPILARHVPHIVSFRSTNLEEPGRISGARAAAGRDAGVHVGAVERVTRAWGIGTPDLFASTTLMRPVKLGPRQHQGGEPEPLNAYEQSVRMKAKLRSFLTDTDKMPKELIFLGRNMRMVQGNNQSLGSPVNRIKMTGFWASRSLTATPHLTLPERLREYWYYTVFRSVMFTLDVAFWQSKLRAWVRRTVLGKAAGGGFEDELERSMRGFAKSSMGVEIGPGAFEG
ncbi:hypothetical protein FIBSPDRAFT_1055377 [Athelia psychrophila]|uniref:Uncharacterized protein n=1 Tax=Athelia psychrophila TaxID=1759441 RepID=A0A167TU31_9AGAM|nr:hypothetical protein FIBSPDRAFT_1055377 [Fibularhizoctonia sp. CBS 109695]